MTKGALHDLVFETVQEEECLIWDAIVTNPQEWLGEYCDEMEHWNENGTWLSKVVGKMLDSYKE